MSNQPIISILHPTARVKPGGSFPLGWLGACCQFFNTAAHPENCEYVLIVHESRWYEFWDENRRAHVPLNNGAIVVNDDVVLETGVRMPHRWGRIVIVRNTGRDCVVDQINAGAAASSGQLLVGIMDDLEAPEGWDVELMSCLPSVKVHPDHCGDQSGAGCDVCGGSRNFQTLIADVWGEYVLDLTGEPDASHIIYGALTRKRWEKQGSVLHPDFESMYADNYFSEMAHKDGVVIDGRHLGFKHHHFTTGEMVVDDVYALQNRNEAYIQGRAIFERLVHGRKTLAIVMPGENFSAEYLMNIFGLVSNLLPQMNIQPHGGYSSVVHATRYDLHGELLDAVPKPDLALWMDDDNICDYAAVSQLIRDLEEHPELDGIVGWCWCDNRRRAATKAEDWTMSVGKLSAADDFGGHEGLRFSAEDFAGGPIISARDIQARYGPEWGFWTGFPCVLLRYEALVKMGRDCFSPILHPKAQRGFTGEDAAFCWNAHRLGVNLGVDLRVKVPHLKRGAFEPDFGYLESAAPAVEFGGLLHEAFEVRGG